MKKLKHKMVEKMRDSTADTLGITRAVLVNGKSLGVIICDQTLQKVTLSHKIIIVFNLYAHHSAILYTKPTKFDI